MGTSLFIEDPIDHGAGNNNGNVLGKDIYAGGPGPSSSLAHFNQVFSYDNVNRLSTSRESSAGCGGTCWYRNFSYDPHGNGWVSDWGGPPLNASTPTSNVYDGNNHLSTAAYDGAGNQTTVPYVCGNCLGYDAENHLVTATASGTVTFAYDGNGQRVQKTANGQTTVYVYDAFGQMAAEYSSGAAGNPQCNTCYVSWDHLGSTRLVTNESAQVIARHDYFPFGEEMPGNTIGRNGQWGAGNDNITQKFTGQERDSETQLDNFQARYFEAPLGRFTSPDPENAGADLMNPQSWNGYAYVGNNPLMYTDPSGLSIVPCESPESIACVGNDPTPPEGTSGGGNSGGDTSGGGFDYCFFFRFLCEGGGDYQPSQPSRAAPPPPVIAEAQQTGPIPHNPQNNCSSASALQNLLPHGGGLQVGGEVVFAAQWIGNEAQGNVGAGLFYDEGSRFSGGGFATYAAATRVGPVSAATPSQGPPVMVGAYAGGGFSAFLTNARSADQLSGPFQTRTVNVGFGPYRFSASLATGGGIWEFAFGPPFAGVSAPGASFSNIVTNTKTSGQSCR